MQGTEVSAASWQEAGVVKILLNGLLSSQQQVKQAVCEWRVLFVCSVLIWCLLQEPTDTH